MGETEIGRLVGAGPDVIAAIPHGGDLAVARALFPTAPEPWLDLSTGINPIPYPCPAFDASHLRRLPSPFDLQHLKSVAAIAYGASGPEEVVAAPGTQILIETLPRIWPNANVAVVGPTYAEHAAAWLRAGHIVETVPTLKAAAGAQVVVVVNPNNPDGRVHAIPDLRDMAEQLNSRGGLLVVDEAFADLERSDLESEAGENRQIGRSALRLRSFGKSYGLAGLRLGFALGSAHLVRRIEVALGCWAVSGPAIAAGLAALPDVAWRRQAAQARSFDAGRLDRMVRRAGGRVVGGTILFRTAEFSDGEAVFQRLGEAGIYVRRFAESPSRLRFGLPASRPDWCRLSRALGRA